MSKPFTPYDVVKRKLDKLMDNIDKPVVIPERRDERKFPDAPELVRNIMGSSAGAGSGEFHVYRHLRRKEYARQRFIKEQGKKEEADRQFDERVEAKKREAEERTARKRAKRLKKKAKKKVTKSSGCNATASQTDDTDDSDADEDEASKVEGAEEPAAPPATGSGSEPPAT